MPLILLRKLPDGPLRLFERAVGETVLPQDGPGNYALHVLSDAVQFRLPEPGEVIEPPELTSPPILAGTPAPGQTLTLTAGTWNNFTLIRHQVLADGIAVAGETSTSYQVRPEDSGRTITIRERAEGPGGVLDVMSNGLTVT